MKKRMRMTEGQLRKLIREMITAETDPLDQMLPRLSKFLKSIEFVWNETPPGKTKATLTGLHNDLFNVIADFRKLIDQSKGQIKKSRSN